MKKYIMKWTESSLILKIVIGAIIGAILGVFVPDWTVIAFPGELFVNALKAIAPILVFVLVISAIANAKSGIGPRFKTVIGLYLFSTFLAALVAVTVSYLFPVTMHLTAASTEAAPGGLGEVMYTLISSIFVNPIDLLAQGQYLGILFWSVVLGLALKSVASSNTKDILSDFSKAITKIVQGIIQCAPFGVMGLVFKSVSESGLGIFTQYGQLLLLLVTCIALVAFVTDPLISGIILKRNPYPLVLTCLKESGITAFFSRSSALSNNE